MHKLIKQVFYYEKQGMKQQFLLGKWRMELQFSYMKQERNYIMFVTVYPKYDFECYYLNIDISSKP